MKASSGIGLVALILTIISFFIPFVGFFITWLALVIATIAAFMGDRGLTIATVVLSALKFLITPTMWAGAVLTIPVSIILWLLPIVGLIFRTINTGKAEIKEHS